MRGIKNMQASRENIERVLGNSKGKLELFDRKTKDMTQGNY